MIGQAIGVANTRFQEMYFCLLAWFIYDLPPGISNYINLACELKVTPVKPLCLKPVSITPLVYPTHPYHQTVPSITLCMILYSDPLCIYIPDLSNPSFNIHNHYT